MSRVFNLQSQRPPKGCSSNTNVLNSQESECLLASFPITRLSYETTIHKNDKPSFFSGIYKCFVLPKGKRCVAWITEWNRTKVVALIDIVSANNYQGSLSPVIRKFHQENGWYPGSIRLYDACVEHSLVYGSVFSGVIFRINASSSSSSSSCYKTFFSIHSVYWYQGNSIPNLPLSGHVKLCERIFADYGLRQVAYTNQNSIIFGLPILCHDDKNIEVLVRELPYPVFAIQYRFENNTRVCQRLFPFQNELIMETPYSSTKTTLPSMIHSSVSESKVLTQVAVGHILPQQFNSRVPYVQPPDDMLTNIQAIFMVRPNIQNDIYELFVNSSNSRSDDLVFHNFAHITGYKTSVMMNSLFRNIVENRCLDTQEESEDESDFENTEPEKYVLLHKEYLMLCRFNKRFCKWVPMHIINSESNMKSKVITEQQVKQHELRYLKHNRIKRFL